ncbi:MAG TPA: pre-peptidase C-terminal domain-containing protein [Blastocatellia bacterium]|nr:pre-peptidase C-terminal domain-containing protein [Blastocatellia bacterium]
MKATPTKQSMTQTFRYGNPRLVILIGILMLILIIGETMRQAAARTAAGPGTGNARIALARLGEAVSVRAAGRGNPYVSLADGHDLLSGYVGDERLLKVLTSGQARPLSLASADFDEDGVADLIAGYESSDGEGAIVLHRGNADAIYPNTLEAEQRRGNGTLTDAPFLSPALAYSAPRAADFIGAGDFDGDGHADVVVASHNDDRLYLLSGDGQGGLLVSRAVSLPGKVTAMLTGEINRRDGLADLVVGIQGEAGAAALVYEGSQGALNAKPEAFGLSQAATSLALGQLDGEACADLAIAAGRELIIVHGRDRKLLPGGEPSVDAPPAIIESRSFAEPIESVVTGHFTGEQVGEIALSFQGGRITVLTPPVRQARASSLPAAETTLSRKPFNPIEPLTPVLSFRDASNKLSEPKSLQSLGTWSMQSLGNSAAIKNARLVGARVSSTPVDNLLVAGAAENMKIVVAGQPANQEMHGLRAADLNRETVEASIDAGGEVAAVLPMRLNKDALSDLVVLKAGSVRPAVIPTVPQAIFVVTNTNDSGANSLRDMITQANAAAGADEIRFSLGGSGVRTISLASALPAITGAVTIDGYSQSGTVQNSSASGDNATLLVELNGTSAGAADGLSVTTGNCVVRGLVINRFSRAGINVSSAGANRIEGNFVGVNATGTAKLANQTNGVSVSSAGNTIGGTTAAAKNVISGNVVNGIHVSSGAGNVIQGNHIGTNAAATAVLGNGNDGVLIQSAASATVGGTSATRNIVGGNGNVGVEMKASQAYLIQIDSIGTESSATLNLGNLKDGIKIDSQSNNGTVRDVVLAFNGGAGIKISTAIIATLRPNVLTFANVGGDQVSFTDSFCTVACPVFQLCSLPAGFGINSASVSGNTISVTGYLFDSARPNKTITFDLYSGALNASGGDSFGSLPTYLGAAAVTTDFRGLASFTLSPITLPAGSSGHFVNARATVDNNTFNKSNFLQIGSGCSYAVTPATRSVPASGGTGSFAVQTQGNCAWQASFDNCASSVDVASGTGSKTVNYTIFTNYFPTPRTLTFLVQGQLHIVTQAAAQGGGGGSCPATAISLGQSVPAAISDSDCAAPHVFGHKADLYTFSATAGQIVTINMKKLSNSLDPFLILSAPDGTVIAVNDDTVQGVVQDSQITYRVQTSGTYTIEATTYTDTDRGPYMLSLTESVCTPMPINIGQTINASIADSDCNDAQGFKGDFYSFTATAGQTIIATMTKSSATIDPYLFLVGPGGSVLVEDDDSAGPPNAQITFTIPSSGTYTIEATTYDLLDRGAYSLSLAFMSLTTCNFTLSPTTSASVGAAGGTGSFNVNVGSGCNWTAVSSNTSWLTTASAGSGNGPVNYSYAQNSGSAQRIATITVGGQTYTVTQAGTPTLEITGVVKDGKHFLVSGIGFVGGATLLVNGEEKKTRVDSSTSIFSKKGAKGVSYPAHFRVRNPDNSLSNDFTLNQP